MFSHSNLTKIHLPLSAHLNLKGLLLKDAYRTTYGSLNRLLHASHFCLLYSVVYREMLRGNSDNKSMFSSTYPLEEYIGFSMIRFFLNLIIFVYVSVHNLSTRNLV